MRPLLEGVRVAATTIMFKWLIQQWNEIKGNAKWYFLCLAGSGMISVGGYLLRRIQELPDWVPFAIIFLLSLAAFLWLGRSSKSPNKKQATLQERTFELCKEIRRFLKDLGPRPEEEYSEDMDLREFIKRNLGSGKIGRWLDKLIHGFQLQFANRIDHIAHEFGEQGIHDPDLVTAIRQQPQDEQSIQTIAERLTYLASKLDE